MRKASVVAALVGSYTMLIGFMAVLAVALSVALADGWAMRQAAERHDDASPRFSPDGSQVAFLRGTQLWLMAVDGSDQRPVTRARRFAWTPGGRLLVSRGGRVLGVDPDGGGTVPVHARELPRATGSDRHGARVVFARDHRIWLRLGDGTEVELT